MHDLIRYVNVILALAPPPEGNDMSDPTPPSGADLDLAIIDATREYIAAARARPRDPARIAAARATLDDLLALTA